MTMKPHKVRISAPLRGKDASVELDGRVLEGVRSFKVESSMDGLTVFTVTFLADVNRVESESGHFRDPEAEYRAARERHDGRLTIDHPAAQAALRATRDAEMGEDD